MQVSNLTVEELKALIQETVAETIQSLLIDPDFSVIDPDAGKQLRPEVEQRLRLSLQRTQSGERGLSLTEVVKKLGLDLE